MTELHKNQINRLRKSFFEAYDDDDILKAILTGERILKMYEYNNCANTLYFCDDAYNLACVYSKDGKFSNSISLLKKSAETFEKLQGKNLHYTNILNNMAIDLSNSGQYSASLKIFKEIYSIRRSILEENHPDYINCLLNLGNSYFDINDIENAVIYHKKSLSLRDRKDLDYADNLNLIGYDLEEKEDYEKAADYFLAALDIIKKIKGGRSDEYLKNIYYLGSVYDKNKNFAESKNCYEKSVELIKVYIGEEHPYYAEALNKLANSYMRLGNENKALTLRIKSLNIIKNIVGKNHLYYASNLKNIGDIYFKKNDFKRAKKMYEESIEIKKSILGVNNDEYIRDSSMLAKTYIKEKNLSAAEKILENLTYYFKSPDGFVDINDKDSDLDKDFYVSLLLDLASIYVTTNNAPKLYAIYKEFESLEPGLSFDDMLNDIKSFAENENIPLFENDFTEDSIINPDNNNFSGDGSINENDFLFGHDNENEKYGFNTDDSKPEE